MNSLLVGGGHHQQYHISGTLITIIYCVNFDLIRFDDAPCANIWYVLLQTRERLMGGTMPSALNIMFVHFYMHNE